MHQPLSELTNKKKFAIMMAIISVLLFAAINQTIVSTALPKIVSKIGGMEYYDWIFTGFMLASTITAVIVGRLSDIYGRKYFILIGIGVFTIASFLNGFSSNIGQLIAFRTIQGFGAGMIMSTAFTTVGDLYTPAERGKWQGVLGGVFGIASVLGPTVGGFIVDHYDWHWVFWVFLPFGVIAFGMIQWLLPVSRSKDVNTKIDYYGAAILSVFITTLLLGFSWAGKTYAWDSVQIIGLFSTAIISLILFIYVELKVEAPILPLWLFKNSIFTIGNICIFIMGIGMFGTIMYVSLYAQGVMGLSATSAGRIEMAMTLAMVVTSTIGGQIMSRTGRYKALAVAGFLVMSTGMFMNTFLSSDSTTSQLVMNVIVIGLGLGLASPVFTLAIQNSVDKNMLGSATSSTQLFRQLGGTVGVAVMGTIMNRMTETRVTESMKEVPLLQKPEVASKLEPFTNPQLLMNPEKLADIRSQVPDAFVNVFDQLMGFVRSALDYSLTHVFLIGAIVVLVAAVFALFLKEIPIENKKKQKEEPAEDSATV